MKYSQVVFFILDITTRGLATLTLLKAFPYLFQEVLFGKWDMLIWLYPIFWLALLFLSVHPDFIMNKMSIAKVRAWLLTRVPALLISIVGVFCFFRLAV